MTGMKRPLTDVGIVLIHIGAIAPTALMHMSLLLLGAAISLGSLLRSIYRNFKRVRPPEPPPNKWMMLLEAGLEALAVVSIVVVALGWFGGSAA
jgi:hypothetical protein